MVVGLEWASEPSPVPGRCGSTACSRARLVQAAHRAFPVRFAVDAAAQVEPGPFFRTMRFTCDGTTVRVHSLTDGVPIAETDKHKLLFS